MGEQDEIEKAKRDLVQIIIRHLREKRMSVQEAKSLAQDFLNELPVRNYQDLLSKLKKIGEKYPEAKAVYIQELKQTNENKRSEVLLHMREAIVQGKMEEAIRSAKSLNN